MTKDSIADAFEDLIKTRPFNKITISMICDTAHVGRNTFYYYFQHKQELIDYICTRDYQKNSSPYHEIRTENIGVQSFFTYLYNNKELYLKLYDIDQGITLRNALMNAQKSVLTQEYARRFSNKKQLNSPKIDQTLFWLYGAGGVSAIQVHWIGTKMKMPINTIAENLRLLFENSLFTSLTEYLY